MSEILSNTGAKLWSKDDYSELWLNVFEQLTGTGGNSNIRLIDEAIGKINTALNGYYLKIINNRLYICKDESDSTTTIPVSLIDSSGTIASTVDGTTITIDENGVVHGTTVDDVFSLTSTNPVQNKVVKAKIDEMDAQIEANKTTISSHTTALETLNGEGEGSVKKIANEAAVAEVAKVVADAPADFDTLKEMYDWISGHEDDAAAMNSAIQTNKSDIATLKTDKVDKETGKSLLANTDKANYDDANVKKHTHSNKSVLDGITSNKVTTWDTIGNKLDKTGDSSNTTNTFSEATSRTNIVSGEKSSILFGKIKKWFSDLKAVAFSGSYNDLSNTPTIDTALSDTSTNAVQNKAVKAQIDALNTAIDNAKALRASLEQYGMVQLNDTSVVTDSTGLALPATEKNPNLSGTLANQISQLNTNLQWEQVTDANNFQNPYKVFKEDSLNIKVYKSGKEAIVTFDGVSSSEFTDNYWLLTKLPVAICEIYSVVYVSNEDATIKQPYRALLSEGNINLFWSGTIPSGYHICGTFYYPIA